MLNKNFLKSSPTLAAIAVLLCIKISIAQEVYKTVDEHGNIIYSEQPPNKTSETITIQVTPAPSEAEQERALQRARKLQNTAQDLAAKRAKQKQSKHKTIADARKEVARAEKNLIISKEVGPGDRQGTASGGSRFTQAYRERIRAAEKRVEVAKQRLKEIQSGKPGK